MTHTGLQVIKYLADQFIEQLVIMVCIVSFAILLLLLSSSVSYPELGYHPTHPHFLEHNGTYHTRIVSLDLDVILASRRLVHNYVACLMDIKPCTHEGDELKKILPDAIATKCIKCTARQKEGASRVINTLQDHYPMEWEILKEKWDLDQLKDVL